MSANAYAALAAAATAAIPAFDVVAFGQPQRRTEEWLETAVVDSTGRRFSVRAALTETAGLKLAAEQPVLAALAGHELPFDVAATSGSGRFGDDHPLVVYPELPGHRLVMELFSPDVARSVGAGLGALHELPAQIVADLDLPAEDAATIRTRYLAEVDEAARTSRVPATLLNRWEQALEDVALWQFSSCVIHGDISDESLRLHETALCAVTDWSGLRLGDPAVDLAWLFASAPEDSLDALEESYSFARSSQPDPHLIDRALLISELALARWLLHGVRSQSPQVIADAEEMLATLARQVGDDRPLGRSAPVIDTGWQQWSDTYDEPDDDEH